VIHFAVSDYTQPSQIAGEFPSVLEKPLSVGYDGIGLFDGSACATTWFRSQEAIAWPVTRVARIERPVDIKRTGDDI
jgi:hypothetical protein